MAKALARIESLENEIKEIDLAMADRQLDYEEINKFIVGKKN